MDKGGKECNVGLKQNQENLYLRVVMIFLSLGKICVHRTFTKDDNSGQNDTEIHYKPTESSYLFACHLHL